MIIKTVNKKKSLLSVVFEELPKTTFVVNLIGKTSIQQVKADLKPRFIRRFNKYKVNEVFKENDLNALVGVDINV